MSMCSVGVSCGEGRHVGLVKNDPAARRRTCQDWCPMPRAQSWKPTASPSLENFLLKNLCVCQIHVCIAQSCPEGLYRRGKAVPGNRKERTAGR